MDFEAHIPRKPTRGKSSVRPVNRRHFPRFAQGPDDWGFGPPGTRNDKQTQLGVAGTTNEANITMEKPDSGQTAHNGVFARFALTSELGRKWVGRMAAFGASGLDGGLAGGPVEEDGLFGKGEGPEVAGLG